jgi:hypothetical protein
LGPDHPITLIAATALVTSTAHDDQASLDLAADTVVRVGHVLGPQHPLAITLHIARRDQFDEQSAC